MATKEGHSKRHQKKLFQAVIRGNVHLLKEILTDGHVDVNAYDIDSRTPLMHGVVLENSNARVPITTCLIETGADANAKDADGKTALMYAVSDHENKRVVQTLLTSHRTDPNVQDLEGNTALMHAVNSDNVQAIRALVDQDSINNPVDIKMTNKHGYSALLMAVKLRRAECCRVLVKEAKADPNDVSKHWQATLSRMLQGDSDTSGKKTTLQRGRRSSISSLPPTLKQSAKTPLLSGSWSKPRLDSASSAKRSVMNSFNSTAPEHQTARSNHRERRNSVLRNSFSRNREGYIEDASSEDKDVESLKEMLNSFDLHFRPTTSREDSQSSLFSESTMTITLKGRPRTLREGSDSSIDTISTLQSRPNTRQDSDLSIQTLGGSIVGRSPKFPRENSAVFRKGLQQPVFETRAVPRSSWSRPSTSLMFQSMSPWVNSRDGDGWLQNIPQMKADPIPRTFSSMSSYKHGVRTQTDKLQTHPPRMFTGRTAKETALKHIRGNMRLPLTPTPPTHRLFSREDKTLRHLPTITGSKH